MRNRLDRRIDKRGEAEDRQADHNKLTVQQKLDKAIDRPGNSRKEIARLSA